jgi:hypothetical protein
MQRRGKHISVTMEDSLADWRHSVYARARSGELLSV